MGSLKYVAGAIAFASVIYCASSIKQAMSAEEQMRAAQSPAYITAQRKAHNIREAFWNAQQKISRCKGDIDCIDRRVEIALQLRNQLKNAEEDFTIQRKEFYKDPHMQELSDLYSKSIYSMIFSEFLAFIAGAVSFYGIKKERGKKELEQEVTITP